jgi:hypothetical protein
MPRCGNLRAGTLLMRSSIFTKIESPVYAPASSRRMLTRDLPIRSVGAPADPCRLSARLPAQRIP